MRLTTKGRYAVTAMLDVAIHDSVQPVRIAEIAERQGISQSYLEQLFSNLKKKGLVCGRRGPGGGYQLGRKSKLITVADVIDAVNEKVDATRCGGLKNCTRSAPCLTHDLWEDLSIEIRSFLNRITLESLVRKKTITDERSMDYRYIALKEFRSEKNSGSKLNVD